MSDVDLKPENYLDLTIAPFTATQIEVFLKQYPDHFGRDFANLATKVSEGNPSIVEQMVLLASDVRRLGISNPLYKTINEIIIHRLNILKNEDSNSYRMLMAMSILGVKFYPALTNFSIISSYS